MKKLLFVGALVASLSSCKTALPGYATGVTSEGKTGVAEAKSFLGSVSYTHLTLPTTSRV